MNPKDPEQPNKEFEEIIGLVSDYLTNNPDVFDMWLAKMPAEISFVMRRLTGGTDAMRSFVELTAPLFSERLRLSLTAFGGDKKEILKEIIHSQEFLNSLMQAVTERSAEVPVELSEFAWWNRYKQGLELLEREKFAEARLLFEESLAECDSTQPESLLSFGILRGLAIACAGLGDLEELEPLLKRWLKAGELQLGKWHPELAYPCSMLALIREEQGDYADAQALHERAVKILERTKAGNDLELAGALDELACFHVRRQNYEKAEKLFLKVIKTVDEIPECPESDKIEYLIKLVDTALLSKRFEAMEPICRRVLSYLQAHEPLDVWYPLGTLACCFVEQGKQAEAEVAFERVVELIRQTSTEHNEGFRRVFEAYLHALTNAGLADRARAVQAIMRRLVYELFEVKTADNEILASGLPFSILADVLYRLESPDMVLELDEETEADYRKQIKDIVIKQLQNYFAERDFLEIYTNLAEVERQVKTQLDNVVERKGFGVVFRFREFSDKIGFLEVIGKLQNADNEAEAGRLTEAEAIYEEAILEAREFPQSGLLRYVCNEYADYLDNAGKHDKAREVREQNS